eukprot:CAMPEP_0174902192 /NCGR_PEP_ID=MMETSP0167-20121228/37196_1 /TAXON_ID=38298 /ORGANISM="Rhodella maculata, Strain CCMP736" /LENGTH=98 /DNA_ID=CAMNT_0016144129 /DNA_START=266 /DNA_END=560 /DNA_ORIENTATION=-
MAAIFFFFIFNIEGTCHGHQAFDKKFQATEVNLRTAGRVSAEDSRSGRFNERVGRYTPPSKTPSSRGSQEAIRIQFESLAGVRDGATWRFPKDGRRVS